MHEPRFDDYSRPSPQVCRLMKDRSVPMREQGLGKKKGVAKRKARKRHEEAQASKPEAEKAGPQALS